MVTHIHTQPFYGCMGFVRDNPGELVPEETFTHFHLSWSLIISYLLHQSTTIHDIFPVQSMRLTVFFHNLSLSFLWSTSSPGTIHFILHTFLHPIIVFFSQHMLISLLVINGTIWYTFETVWPCYVLYFFYHLLWHCWLGVRKSIRPVKKWVMGTSVVICLECGANNLHMVKLMPLPPRHLLLQ